jgi:signal transduction histidine kinase
VQIQFLELNQVHTYTHAIYIYQILVNLISNAIDASAGSETKKVLIILKRQGRSYSIECKDFGSGMPKNILRQIKKPGYTTKPDGHGFGLYSVRFIVEKRMYGRLSASSDPEEGSLFSCRIPLRGRKVVGK